MYDAISTYKFFSFFSFILITLPLRISIVHLHELIELYLSEKKYERCAKSSKKNWFYTNLNEISVFVLTLLGFALSLLPSTNYVFNKKGYVNFLNMILL